MKKNFTILGYKKDEAVGMSEMSKNRHIAVLGGSGSGKTSQITMLAVEAARRGNLVVELNMRNCLNPECLMESVKREYLQVRKRCDIMIDGLRIPLFTEQKGESKNSATHRVTSLLAQAGKLNPTQTAYLKEAVSAVYEADTYSEDGIRAIQDFLECQEGRTAKNVAGKLRSILDDNLIIDGEDPFDDAEGILEIDINGLQYDDQIVFANFILDYLLRKAEKGAFLERNICIVVDECQNFSYALGTTMYTLLNESRRLGISLILAATELSTNKAASVVEQCGTVLYFAPTPTSRRKIAKKIAPQDVLQWVYKLSKLEVGEFVASGRFSNREGKSIKSPCLMKSIVPAESAMQTEKVPLEDKVG